MKATLIAASLLALSAGAFASDTNVSVSIGQPGFYGRIDIGNYPQPQLIYREPVIIQRPVQYIERAPIYLRVPPGHAKHWSKHCRSYNACGQRVYFVQDSWYTNEYAPRYRAGHGKDRHDDRRDDRYDDRGPRDNGHGNGNGKGNGNGHGNGNGNGHGNGNGRDR